MSHIVRLPEKSHHQAIFVVRHTFGSRPPPKKAVRESQESDQNYLSAPKGQETRPEEEI